MQTEAPEIATEAHQGWRSAEAPEVAAKAPGMVETAGQLEAAAAAAAAQLEATKTADQLEAAATAAQLESVETADQLEATAGAAAQNFGVNRGGVS